MSREPDLESERAERFEDIFDRHAGRVYAYAARRSTPSVADEVVGETFLIAWRKLDAIPPEALPWLLNVAGKVLGRLPAGPRWVGLAPELGETGTPASVRAFQHRGSRRPRRGN